MTARRSAPTGTIEVRTCVFCEQEFELVLDSYNTRRRSCDQCRTRTAVQRRSDERRLEQVRTYKKQWVRDNLDRHRMYAARSQTKKYGGKGIASLEQIAARVEVWGHRCWLCGAPWEETDHVIPLSRGGTNWPANIRPICGPCNRRKAAKPLSRVLAP